MRPALQADLEEQWGGFVDRRGSAPFWFGLRGPKSLLIHGPLKRLTEKLREHCGGRGARPPRIQVTKGAGWMTAEQILDRAVFYRARHQWRERERSCVTRCSA